MRIYVYIAFSDDGSVMGCFRTHAGAIECIKENALFIMNVGFSEREKARILAEIEKGNYPDGFGYIESAGELGD